MSVPAAALALAGVAKAAAGGYTTYLPNTVPNQTEPGDQFGTNQCAQWGDSSQDSLCQTLYVNSVDDFCLWGPPYSDGVNATIGATERQEVAWCTKKGYGTRLIPDGTLTGVHFVKTPSYILITGHGDFTKIGIPAGDGGGELDPHGYDAKGNPIGGLVFTKAYNNTPVQSHEWSFYIGATTFCAKTCLDGGVNAQGNSARQLCPHIYDEMGCQWVMPGNYDDNVIETCDGAVALPAGLYGSVGNFSTFSQGQPVTPDAHPAGASSNCVTTTIAANGAPAWTLAPGVTPNASAAVGGTGAQATGGSSGNTKNGNSNGGSSGSSGSSGSDGGSSGSNGGAMTSYAVPAVFAFAGALLGAAAVL